MNHDHQERLSHPFHRAHTLSLISSNGGNPFMCDACGEVGKGSSYRCEVCNINLHVLCASKPLFVTDHQSHHHKLALSFSPPYQSKSFSCDICQQIGSNQWLYRCEACQFDAHLSCVSTVTASPSPSPIQTASRSPPPPRSGINQSHNPISMHQLQQQLSHTTRPQQPIPHPPFPISQNPNPNPNPGVVYGYGPVRPAIGQVNSWRQVRDRVVIGASEQFGVTMAQELLDGAAHAAAWGSHAGHGHGYGGHGHGHHGYGGGHGYDSTGTDWGGGSSTALDLDGGGGGTWDGDSSSYDYDTGIDGGSVDFPDTDYY